MAIARLGVIICRRYVRLSYVRLSNCERSRNYDLLWSCDWFWSFDRLRKQYRLWDYRNEI